MDEALKSVKESLGPDAMILETKSAPGGNGTSVEIIAMLEGEDQGLRDQEQGNEEVLSQSHSSLSVISEVRREIAELKSMFQWLVPGIGQTCVLDELLTQGLSPDIIARLAQEIREMEGTDEREKVRQALSRMIPACRNLESKTTGRKVLALIGPTGVGKTTTLVKLTIRLTRQIGCRVGWVCMDNRRIGGGEQTAAYAEILRVPYEIPQGEQGLEQAMGRLSDCDLIFIDTPGVSPKDNEGVEEISSFTRRIPKIKHTLLLSSSTNIRDMTAWMDLYEKVGFDFLIFSKVDECSYFGPLINAAITSSQPVSYFTTGQKLVEDLEVATPESLACLLLPYEGLNPRNGLSGNFQKGLLQKQVGSKPKGKRIEQSSNKINARV